MIVLDTISKEFAEHLLSEVSFDDRLVGMVMSGTAGNSTEHIYSYKELYKVLASGTYDELIERGHATMSYIDNDKMLNWIANTYGDKELSDVMRHEMEKCNSNAEKLNAARIVLKKRIDQCVEVLKK